MKGANKMKTILLLENNEQQRILYKQKLSNEGYNVITANDGRTAIKKVNDYWPDIVVMNPNIPDIDIVDVIGNIIIQYKNIPIIINTGNYFYGGSAHSWQVRGVMLHSSGFYELKDTIKTLLNETKDVECNPITEEQLCGFFNSEKKNERLCA
ncbi:MAG: response regulator [Planctomycetes bacterium]|nr:response regulator [Planctomycetota bacterium]